MNIDPAGRAGQVLHKWMNASFGRRRDFEDTEFMVVATTNFTAHGFGQQLVAEADTEKRNLKLFHSLADGEQFGSQPRVFLLFPNVHGTAHYPQPVESGELGNGVSGMQVYLDKFNVVLLRKETEYPRVLARHMFEHQDPHAW